MGDGTQERRRNVVEPLPGCEPEIGRMLWEMQDARLRTLGSLEGLTAEELDAPAPEGGNGIGSLLYHMASVEASWLYEDVLQQPFPPDVEELFPRDMRDGTGKLSEVRGQPLESYLRRLEVLRDKLLEAYRSMTLEEFRQAKYVEEYHYDVSPEWALYHLMQHEAEHRGHIEALRDGIKASR